MERSFAEEILASIPEGKRSFRYFKDRYALQLLAYAAAEGRTLHELRRGRFRPLLQKPAVRRVMANRGGRGVDWRLLDSYYPPATEDYVMTLDLWGHPYDSTGWFQTTRPGLNVVVQLNFPETHSRAYRRYIEPRDCDPFEMPYHPIHRGGHHTMAWSRIDIGLDHGEALIEEIQSDWIRDANQAAEEALTSLLAGDLERPSWLGDAGCDALQLFRYVEYVLGSHRKMWEEATLAASLWLLRERLGLRRIYMHTHASGCRLKKITRTRPPRSIYEQLPRRFCFERVDRIPRFLQRSLAGNPGLSSCEFWLLEI